MMTTINIRISSGHVNMPLPMSAVFSGSAATFFIEGVPNSKNGIAVTTCTVRVTNAAGTVMDVTASRQGNGWTATFPATHFSAAGSVSKGVTVSCGGTDEGNNATTWRLGAGDLVVIAMDASATNLGVLQHVNYRATLPTTPATGDLCKISGTWKLYNGSSWETLGGGGGTGDYNDLTNKPQIGGVTLTGNKTAADLGLVANGGTVSGVVFVGGDLSKPAITQLPPEGTIPASVLIATKAALTAHTGATNNPHGVTAAQVGAYVKPDGGIPATDMAAAVQTALTAAANAAPQATTYTKEEVDTALAGKVAATDGTANGLKLSDNDLAFGTAGYASIHYTESDGESRAFFSFTSSQDDSELIPDGSAVQTANTVAAVLPYALSTTATAPATRTVITKVLAAGATSDSYTLPAIDGTANTVQNCDIVVDARACTGDSIALTLTPTGTDIILYPGGNAPTLKKGTVTVIDCTSVKLGDDLVWLVMGATEMKTAS